MKDKFAMLVSGACLLHCILTPMLIGMGIMGAVGEWLGSEWTHRLLLVPVVMLALLSLPSAYRFHRQHWPIVLAILAITALITSLVVPERFELLLTVPAAILLIVAHGWNLLLMRQFGPVIIEPVNG
ncbi:MerC mercury resistance protein [Methylophaga frappieri]|uniref:MerC mercury resistance protein n=1 Tax=Methylophaga frappieri (strain ATCC BAA-2434 / DSM 25690 / JAM7) TaxID=754477 RepID=I1YL21_METFJ|nr:MerC domain-containing protein [Methylophaga frappieri]AFJ03614.1 MerC mercury resistance protein [Methylophaga frappieri]